MAMIAPKLDHVVQAVRDLDGAEASFRRLGFVVTPRNLHAFGTGNHLVIFDDTFLELISVVDPVALDTPAAGDFSMGRHMAAFLAEREGVAMICLKSPDCDADAASLETAGITVHGPGDFFRTGEMPDGSVAEVRGRFMLFPNAAMPHASLFAFDHRTPDCFWRSEWQAHPNGAQRILRVVQAARVFAPMTDYYRRVFGPERVDHGADKMVVDTGNATFEIVEPDEIVARYPEADVPPTLPASVALTLGVDDLDATARWFAERGVETRAVDGSVRIGPEQAHGAILEFVAG